MNSDLYFKIVSEYGNVVHIRPQGCWTDEIAAQFGNELKEKFSAAVSGMENKQKHFIVLANMSDFHIDGEKTSLLLTELMKISGGNPYFFKTVQIIPSVKTRLEIKEASKKSGQANVKFVVADMKEANQKIMELKKELLNMI